MSRFNLKPDFSLLKPRTYLYYAGRANPVPYGFFGAGDLVPVDGVGAAGAAGAPPGIGTSDLGCDAARDESFDARTF